MKDQNQVAMFKTPNEFSLYIEEKVINEKNTTHVDAILKYCKDNMLDEEDIKHLINKSLYNKLKKDFIDMHYLKQTTTSINL